MQVRGPELGSMVNSTLSRSQKDPRRGEWPRRAGRQLVRIFQDRKASTYARNLFCSGASQGLSCHRVK